MDRRRWVEPDLPAERVEEGWEAVAARVGKTRSRARLWLPAGALAAAAAAVLAFVVGRGSEATDPSAWAGTALRTGNEPMQVELADGSEIEAEPHSRLALLEGNERTVRLALREGAATFDVTRDPSRAFVVEADDVTVRVVGTRFTVRRVDADGSGVVEVDVERGRVEVRSGGETRMLGAGETWSRRRQETVEVRRDGPVAEAEPAAEAPDETETPAPAPARRRRTADRRGPDATTLFESAREARRDGRPADAAALYERLVQEHPRNARAPLAALELGRLRMDTLGDPRGAVEALETALRLAPSSPFREDALARLVRAQDSAGSRGACVAARDRYLTAYPDGRWTRDVERRCGGAD